MFVSIRLKDKGESRLFLQPAGDLKDRNAFILIQDENDISLPYMRLFLEENKCMCSCGER